jgi:RND superfamily putative drug exporter
MGKAGGLARVAVKHPRRVLAVWGVAIGLLGLVGLHVENQLHHSNLVIPGTTSARAIDLIRTQFGERYDLVVLLEGPQHALDRQGPALVRALQRRPSVTVVSPFGNRIGATPMRRSPTQAVLMVRVARSFEEVSKHYAPALRKELHSRIHAPLQAHLTGYTDVASGVNDGTVAAIKQAEFIAAPLLMLVLLLVFRSPVAAALPLTIGFTTIGGTRGVLALVNGLVPLDALSLNVATAMGLALGVDYALLMVSRFREELQGGADVRTAAEVTVGTAGRTVRFAGIALGLTALAAMLVVPGDMLVSISFGLLIAIVISVVSALVAIPALLMVFGGWVNRFSFGSVAVGDSRVGRLAMRSLRHPALAAGLVMLLVLALAAPALGLQTGPPDPRELPASSVQRQDYEHIRHVLGAGWLAPYEIEVVARHGTITDPKRLAAIDRFQRRLAARPDVTAVFGPGAMYAKTKPLEGAGGRLRSAGANLVKGEHGLARINGGLGQAGAGIQSLKAGIAQAAAGASALQSGSGTASRGADALRAGIARLQTGAGQLHDGLLKARRASSALRHGSSQALGGIRRLTGGIATARAGVSRGLPAMADIEHRIEAGQADLQQLRQPVESAQRSLADAQTAMNAMLATSKADPQYRAAYQALASAIATLNGTGGQTSARTADGTRGVAPGLGAVNSQFASAASANQQLMTQTQALRDGLSQLASGGRRLQRGLSRLESGTSRLLAGVDRLARGSEALTGGTGRLASGGAALTGGLSRLEAGSSKLAGGLAAGGPRVQRLRAGVARLSAGIVTFQTKTKRLAAGLGQARQLAPAMRSGYLPLAVLEQGPAAQRRMAGAVVNVDRSGTTGRIMIVGVGDAQKAGHPLRRVLMNSLGPLARATGTVAMLDGTATALQDFDTLTADRLPILVGVLFLVTYVALVVMLRSLLLPLLAVLFNLLTAAAGFGAMALAFQGHPPPLGGPGFIDAITAFGIFAIMFGLSIDYEVFLLARMKEGRALTGTTDGAVAYGIRTTAGVVTGAALIMTAVFIAFAVTDISTTRELGVGLTTAVLLDATLVRLVLLPGAIRLCGERTWWLPAPLERWLDARQRVADAVPTPGLQPSKEAA